LSLPDHSTLVEKLEETMPEPLDELAGTSANRPPESRRSAYIVIPTLNESANLKQLVDELERVLDGHPHHILVVDDGSTDGTQELAHSLTKAGYPIDLLERGTKLGIGSAIRDGLRWSLQQADFGCAVTMDADLTHDPGDVPQFVAGTESADLVQGSRYASGARIVDWNWSRRFLSIVANSLVRLILRTGMKEHTNYFRAYSRRAAEAASRAEDCDSYGWALESLMAVRSEGLRVKEVPITYRERTEGSSKLTLGEMVTWVRCLITMCLKQHRGNDFLARAPRFVAVGATGIVVNQVVLFALFGIFGVWPLAALIVAIEASLIWNFEWNDRWTFRGRTNGSSRIRRFALYHAVCAAGIAINVGVFALLALGLGVNYMLSNLVAIVAGFATNFGGSTSWAWAVR
jgi:dolichol-phosphate mannosyltransferase